MGFYREKIFPWLIDNVVTGEEIETIRDRVVEKAAGHVIEIGSGTGANFLSYSDAVRSLTTVDPNPGMNKIARRRIKYLEFPVDSRKQRCENLSIKDASFDVAVTTLTLCSLADVEKSLKEIYRVLKPGGRLLFLEHGLSAAGRVGRWQDRVTPLHRRVFDGCHLNREIDSLVRSAGFSIDELTNYYLEAVPNIFGYMYEGVASK
ncbi:MAG: ubiquinone/menaquinone biosynthesis C-methylase UbiE [Gammaproteobacteria bacterium]|jgi:ubiquinone/menaquinone biosynthesis C-methylase UbiE